MKRIVLLLIAVATALEPLSSGLLINEVVCGASKDWVELLFYSGSKEEIDSSPLYVTMYYGTNEPLGTEPITMFSYDKPGTAWDDRYVVIHPTEPGGIDETDAIGDSNANGIRDIYCNNYFGSFWNTDCVVAIDTNDDPADGGIIDFLAFSNRDGTINSTIESYIKSAQLSGQWKDCSDGNIQLCCVDIGIDGLPPDKCIARKNAIDTHSLDDFVVSSFLTPGRDNIIGSYSGERLISLTKKRITLTCAPGEMGEIPLFVYQPCSLRFRLFSVTGKELYESPSAEQAAPGAYVMKWDPHGARYRLITGLYIGKVEATNSLLRRSDIETLYLIVSR